MEGIKHDLTEKVLLGEEAQDKVAWRTLTGHIDPT